MAAEIHQFTAVIPAGTPASALAVVKMPLTSFDIEQIDIEVPPGPAGLMGFYLALSGQQWVPFETGQFLVWDNRIASWKLNNQPTSYGWEVHGYNTGVNAHKVVVRFHVNIPPSPLTPSAAPVITFVTSNVPATDLVTL